MLGLGLVLGFASGRSSRTPFTPSYMKHDPSKSLDVSGTESLPSGFSFNTEGTRLIVSGAATDDILPFDNVAWGDLSGGSYTAADHDDLANNPTGLKYSPDGSKMFVWQSSTAIEGYTDATHFNPVSNVYNSGLRLPASGIGITFGRTIEFTKDGMATLFAGDGTTKVHYYANSTAYDPNPSTRDTNKEYDVTSVIGGLAVIGCVRLYKDDTVMQILDRTSKKIYYFKLSMAGDPSTAVHIPAYDLDLSGIDSQPVSFEWDATGKYLYVLGSGSKKIYFFFDRLNLSDNLAVAYLGDSIFNNLFVSPGESSMVTDYSAEYKFADLYDCASGGLALITSDNTGAFMNKDALEPTSVYDTHVANILYPEIVQVLFLSLGTNASSLTSGSPELWTAAYAALIENLRALMPNLKAIIPLVMGNNTGITPSLWQAAKETMLEALSVDPLLQMGPEIYDLTMEMDGIHPDSDGKDTQIARMNNHALSVLGKATKIEYPYISAASYSGSTVTAIVTYGGGSSLSGSEVDTFRIEDDGAAVTINSLSISGNEITFTLASSIAAGSVVKLWVNYGAGANVTIADIVRDDNGMALRTVYDMDVTEL